MKLCLRCNQYFEDATALCPTDSSPLEPVGDHPLIGALINDRYVVDSVIGKGSSGIVYKATRLLMQREVAVKVLHSYLGAESGALDRFLREARAASRLRHPHIINIWESGVTDDGQPYFVMDYLEGPTIAELLKEKGYLHASKAVPIIRQICEALAEAHRQNIVHRDVKPENIVIEETDYAQADDYVKVLDFGIADAPLDSIGRPRQRTAAGSPAYMSPEQCQGLQLDQRSDIYSLGIVVYEMFTGIRPFSADDVMKLFHMHVHTPPPSLSSVRPDLRFPAKLENVIAKALSKKPEQRQSTIMEFWKELEDACQDFDLSSAAGPSASADSLTLDSYSVPDIDRLVDSSLTASHNFAATTGSHNFLPGPEELLQAELEAAEVQLNRFRSTSVDIPAIEGKAALKSDDSSDSPGRGSQSADDSARSATPPQSPETGEHSAPLSFSYQPSTRKNNGTASGASITPLGDPLRPEPPKSSAKAGSTDSGNKDSVDRLLKSAKRASESFRSALASDQKNVEKPDQEWSREVLGRKSEAAEPGQSKVNPLANPGGMGSNLDVLDKLSARADASPSSLDQDAKSAVADKVEPAGPIEKYAEPAGIEMKTDTADIDVVSLPESRIAEPNPPQSMPERSLPDEQKTKAITESEAPAKMPAQDEVSAWARKVLGGAGKTSGTNISAAGSVVPLHSGDPADLKTESLGRELERSKQIAEAADRLMGVLRKQPDSESAKPAPAQAPPTPPATPGAQVFGLETGKFRALGAEPEIAGAPPSAAGPGSASTGSLGSSSATDTSSASSPSESPISPSSPDLKPSASPIPPTTPAAANAPAANAPTVSPLRQIANISNNYAGSGTTSGAATPAQTADLKSGKPGQSASPHSAAETAKSTVNREPEPLSPFAKAAEDKLNAAILPKREEGADAAHSGILGRRRFEDAVNRPVESSNPFAKEVDKILDAAIIKTDDHPTVPPAIPGAKPATLPSVAGQGAASAEQTAVPGLSPADKSGLKATDAGIQPPGPGQVQTASAETAPYEPAARRFDPKRFEEPVNKKSEVLNPFASEVEKLLDSAIIKKDPGAVHRPGDDSGKMNALTPRPPAVDLPPFKVGGIKPSDTGVGSAAAKLPQAQPAPLPPVESSAGKAMAAEKAVPEKPYSLAELDQIGRKPPQDAAAAKASEPPALDSFGAAKPIVPPDLDAIGTTSEAGRSGPAPYAQSELDAIGTKPFDKAALDAIGSLSPVADAPASPVDVGTASSSAVSAVKHYSTDELNAIGGGKSFTDAAAPDAAETKAASESKPAQEGLGAAGFGHEVSASAAAFVKSRSESAADVSKLRGSFQKGRGVEEAKPEGGFAGALKSIFGGGKKEAPAKAPGQKQEGDQKAQAKEAKQKQEKLQKEKLEQEKQEKEQLQKEKQEKEKRERERQQKEKQEKQKPSTEKTVAPDIKAKESKGFPGFGGIFGGKKKEESKKIEAAGPATFDAPTSPSWTPDKMPPGIGTNASAPQSLDDLAALAPPTFVSSFGAPGSSQSFSPDFGAPVKSIGEEINEVGLPIDAASSALGEAAGAVSDFSRAGNVVAPWQKESTAPAVDTVGGAAAENIFATKRNETAFDSAAGTDFSVPAAPGGSAPSETFEPEKELSEALPATEKTSFDSPSEQADKHSKWTSSSAGISAFSDAAPARPTGLGSLLSRQASAEPPAAPPVESVSLDAPVETPPPVAPVTSAAPAPSMADLFAKFAKKKTEETTAPQTTLPSPAVEEPGPTAEPAAAAEESAPASVPAAAAEEPVPTPPPSAPPLTSPLAPPSQPESSYISDFKPERPQPAPTESLLSEDVREPSSIDEKSFESQHNLEEPRTLPELEAEPFKFQPPPEVPETGVPRLPASYAAAAFEFEKPEPFTGQAPIVESTIPDAFSAGFEPAKAPESVSEAAFESKFNFQKPQTVEEMGFGSFVEQAQESISQPAEAQNQPFFESSAAPTAEATALPPAPTMATAQSPVSPPPIPPAPPLPARVEAPRVVLQEMLTPPAKAAEPAPPAPVEKPSAGELARAFLARSNKTAPPAAPAEATEAKEAEPVEPPPAAAPAPAPSSSAQTPPPQAAQAPAPQPPAPAPPAAAPPGWPSAPAAQEPAEPTPAAQPSKSLAELAARFDQPISERNKPQEAPPASAAKAPGEFDLKAELTERLNSILTPGGPKPVNKPAKPADAHPGKQDASLPAPKPPGLHAPSVPGRPLETRELKLPDIRPQAQPESVKPAAAIPSVPPAPVQPPAPVAEVEGRNQLAALGPEPVVKERPAAVQPHEPADTVQPKVEEPARPGQGKPSESKPGADAMSRLIEAAKRVPAEAPAAAAPPAAAAESAVGTASGAGQSEALNKKIEAVKKKIAELKGGVDPTRPQTSAQVRLPGESTGSRANALPGQDSTSARNRMIAASQDSTSARNRMLEAAQRAVDTGTQSKMPAVKPTDRMLHSGVGTGEFDPAHPAKIPTSSPSAPARPEPAVPPVSNPKLASRSEDAAALAAQLVTQAIKKKQQQQPPVEEYDDESSGEYNAGFRNVEASVKTERARVGQANQSARKNRARARASFNKPRFGPVIFFFFVFVIVIGGGYYYYENYYIHQAPAQMSVDQMINANKLVEARQALDKLQKTGKLTQKDSDKYFKIAKKYADQSKFDQAIDVLQKAFTRRSPGYRKAQNLLKGYKLMKSSE